jgi:hypothetical protein
MFKMLQGHQILSARDFDDGEISTNAISGI